MWYETSLHGVLHSHSPLSCLHCPAHLALPSALSPHSQPHLEPTLFPWLPAYLRDPTDTLSQYSMLLIQSTYHSTQLNNYFNSLNVKSISLIPIHFHNVPLNILRDAAQCTGTLLWEKQWSSLFSLFGPDQCSVHCVQITVKIQIHTHIHVISLSGF